MLKRLYAKDTSLKETLTNTRKCHTSQQNE